MLSKDFLKEYLISNLKAGDITFDGDESADDGRLSILLHGKFAGRLVYNYVENCNPKQFAGYWEDAKMPQFNLPKRFTYLWIEKIMIQSPFRGKGIGSEVLKIIMTKAKKPIVIGLNPAAYLNGEQSAVENFYKQLGFKLWRDDGDVFALKVIG
jgi:GNAT superfamily N-acetyltransferase